MNQYQTSSPTKIRIARLIVADVTANTATNPLTMRRRNAGTRSMTILERPVTNALVAPIERLIDAPIYAKVVAAATGLAAVVRGDIIFLLILLLCASNVFDFFLGKEASKARKQAYDPDRARAGMLTKLTGLVLIFFVRFFEHWGAQNDIPGLAGTGGGLAAAIAVTLFIMDMESIEGHRVALGARPIPIFSVLMQKFREVEGKLLVLFATSPTPPVIPPTPKVEP